jgi:hypothetical protein
MQLANLLRATALVSFVVLAASAAPQTRSQVTQIELPVAPRVNGLPADLKGKETMPWEKFSQETGFTLTTFRPGSASDPRSRSICLSFEGLGTHPAFATGMIARLRIEPKGGNVRFVDFDVSTNGSVRNIALILPPGTLRAVVAVDFCLYAKTRTTTPVVIGTFRPFTG